MRKKAVSPMIAYVLLIVIGISVAFLVYQWMKLQIPAQLEKCPEDVRIIIKDYECSQGNKINLIFQNKGLFNIDGVYVRYSDKPDEITATGLKPSGASNSLTNEERGFLYFGVGIPNPLAPDKTYNQTFDYGELGLIKRVQVQPFVLSEENKIVLCSENTITDKVEC
ncbi:hypothetical protein COX97_04240 [Candidatus Pacearchaeota archaeon CG_4_10_14_0_2_um_filter_05_32_18]|nr:MAG: hypothetical protein COX97_04240 [Candidatus Pacearchaeota archaeon CG_4_10_14_0_2_um_filter_05_32_18]